MSRFQFWWMSLELTLWRRNIHSILAGVGIGISDCVLDYGAGPGQFSLVAAGMVGLAGHVYALDIVPAAAYKISKLAHRKGLTNLSTITSDCATGLPNDSIDIGLMFDNLHMLSQPDHILAELHRVLKPGGRLAVNCHHWSGERIVETLHNGGLFTLSSEDNYNYYFART